MKILCHFTFFDIQIPNGSTKLNYSVGEAFDIRERYFADFQRHISGFSWQLPHQMPKIREKGKNITRVTFAAQCANFEDLHSGRGTAPNALPNYNTSSSKPFL